MTTLISFLGKKSNGYRKATYRFSADFVREVPFFGMALADYLKPDRLILMGTAGSMWDAFFIDGSTEDDDIGALEDLIAAASEERVTCQMLGVHAERLSRKLGFPVTCQLIPLARDDAEQSGILQELSGSIVKGEHVVLDVTHSFRHLPMLALVAARFLKHVRDVEVEDIYYGALEMTPPGGETPVLRLGGMLRMLDWVDALAVHDHDGSYNQFAGLMPEDSLSDRLQKAQFHEQIGQIGQARKPLKKLADELNGMAADDPFLSLFAPQLRLRVDWAQGEKYAERQIRLARQFLRTGQYARSIEMGYEAFINRLVQQRGRSPEKYVDREAVKKQYEDQRWGGKATWEAYCELRELRNAVAHGTTANQSATQRALASEGVLVAHLEKLFAKLLIADISST